MANLGDLLADQLNPPDLAAAQEWFQRAATAGDARAMTQLGDLLANRLDPPDLAAAQEWFQRAATAGDARAMTQLGDLLANRLDPPDLAAAQEWFQRAAAGDTQAMTNLGDLLDASEAGGPSDDLDPASPVELPGWDEIQVLTRREREVMLLIAQGLSTAAIAERLMTGEGTVKTHTLRVFGKLGLRSRTQVVAVAYKSGLLRPDVPIRVHPD